MAANISQPPPLADLSYALAIIPDQTLGQKIAQASQAINNLTPNRNLIDTHRFPAHASLFLAGASAKTLPGLLNGFDRILPKYLNVPFNIVRQYQENNQFLALEVEQNKELKSLLNQLTSILRHHQQTNPLIRPRVANRWANLTPTQQHQAWQTGVTTNLEQTNLHFSIADITTHLNNAQAIITATIPLPYTTAIKSFQLVNIGHNNNSWTILKTW